METTAAADSSTPPWETKRKTTVKGRLRKWTSWAIGIGFVALIGYGMRPRAIEVEIGEVSMGPLTVFVVEEGKTRIRNRYTVAAPVSGQMRRVALKAGDEVKANETIISTMEPSIAPLLDARSKAQAEARVQAATAGVQRAQEALEMAKTSSQFAETNWDRIKNGQKGTLSLSDRDNAEREASMRAQDVRANQFAQQVAEYDLAQAKAALLQMDAATTGSTVEIKSPVSGRVLKVFQESAMVVPAGTALVEVGDPMDLEVEAEILSRDAVVIKPGSTVDVTQWGGDTSLQARVRRVEPAAFTKISALGVEEQRVIVLSDLVNPPNDAKALGDRYRVEVNVAVWHADNVLQVPSGALFREGGEWMTFVLADGKAQKSKVTVGRNNGRITEVAGGLNAGQKVLLHPPDNVKDGVGVKPREAM